MNTHKGHYGGGGHGGGKDGHVDVVQGVPVRNDTPKFQTPTKYQDLWAAILFVLSVLGTVVVAVANVSSGNLKTSIEEAQKREEARGHTQAPAEKSGSNPDIFSYMVGTLVFTALLAYGFMVLMRKYPAKYIFYANVAAIAICFANAIFYFTQGAAWGGFVLIVFGLISCLWFYFARHMIPFSALLLETATGLCMRHAGTIVASVLSLFILLVYHFVILIAVLPTVLRAQDDDGSGSAALLVFYLLLYFWALQVIVNVVHVTVSGTIATWYFMGTAGMPPNPTAASAKRALTTSFGSICFGSLVVAILNTLKTLADYARRNSDHEFIACIASCILGCLESLMEYFNLYAFTHVAIYGCSYVEAAKQTWALIKQCVVAAVWNDALIDPVLNLTAFFSSILIGTVLGAIAGSAGVGITCTIISMVVFFIVFRVISSSVITLFVCYAENPDALYAYNPEFQQRIQEASAQCMGGAVGGATQV